MAIKHIHIKVASDNLEETVNAQSKLSDWFNFINESTGSDVTISPVAEIENCASFAIEFPQTTIENEDFIVFMVAAERYFGV